MLTNYLANFFIIYWNQRQMKVLLIDLWIIGTSISSNSKSSTLILMERLCNASPSAILQMMYKLKTDPVNDFKILQCSPLDRYNSLRWSPITRRWYPHCGSSGPLSACRCLQPPPTSNLSCKGGTALRHSLLRIKDITH